MEFEILERIFANWFVLDLFDGCITPFITTPFTSKSIISNNSNKFEFPVVAPISNTPVPEDVELTLMRCVPSDAVDNVF